VSAIYLELSELKQHFFTCHLAYCVWHWCSVIL